MSTLRLARRASSLRAGPFDSPEGELALSRALRLARGKARTWRPASAGPSHQSSRSCRNTGCAGSRRPSMTAATRRSYTRSWPPRATGSRVPTAATRCPSRCSVKYRPDGSSSASVSFGRSGSPTWPRTSISATDHCRPLWIGDDLSLEVLPIVHAPGRHIGNL